jgi:hypothetical protein
VRVCRRATRSRPGPSDMKKCLAAMLMWNFPRSRVAQKWRGQWGPLTRPMCQWAVSWLCTAHSWSEEFLLLTGHWFPSPAVLLWGEGGKPRSGKGVGGLTSDGPSSLAVTSTLDRRGQLTPLSGRALWEEISCLSSPQGSRLLPSPASLGAKKRVPSIRGVEQGVLPAPSAPDRFSI